MIGFNHALTGAIIAKFVPWPIAIPLAIASHFLLDMLPHYGIPHRMRDKSEFWKLFFTLDFIATLSLAYWALSHEHYAIFFCGLAAVSPDFVWVISVIRTRSFSLKTARSGYEKWHKQIQKYEFPKGLRVEIPFAALLFFVAIIRTV